MCSKTDNDDNKNSRFTTLNCATTTVITTTQTSRGAQSCTSNDACMRYCYQFKPNYQLSSNRAAKSPATATAVAAAATAAHATRANCRRICFLVALLAIGLMSSTTTTTTTTSSSSSPLLSLLSSWSGNGFIIGAHAAPQSCTLCDKDDLKAKDPSTSYEEFFFEHQVTRYDAINALKALNESFYVGPSPENSCKSVKCDKKTMKYCLGPNFINDHCWCELGHTDEGLPFVPHICYVGEKMHTASVGSCFFYEEVKECCCAPALAKQWRHISGASRESLSHYLYLLTLVQLILSAGQRLRRGIVT